MTVFKLGHEYIYSVLHDRSNTFFFIFCALLFYFPYSGSDFLFFNILLYIPHHLLFQDAVAALQANFSAGLNISKLSRLESHEIENENCIIGSENYIIFPELLIYFISFLSSVRYHFSPSYTSFAGYSCIFNTPAQNLLMRNPLIEPGTQFELNPVVLIQMKSSKSLTTMEGVSPNSRVPL